MEQFPEDIKKHTNFEHQTIHLKISEFSKTDSQATFPIFHHDMEDAKGFSLFLFHNGRNQETKGCVSMQLFDLNKGPGRNVGVCLISIKDASNNVRLPQSFPFDNKDKCNWVPLVAMDYIARSTLLEHAEEFLPNDTLTLQIDIYFEKNFHNIQTDDLIFPEDKEALSDITGEDHYLKLDSKLGKRLCEESIYFKRIVENPLIEKANKRMKFAETELLSFHLYIPQMLFGVKNIVFDSITSIIDTYIVADRYDITIVSETCLLFLRLCLSDYDDDVLSEFAVECERMNFLKLAECLQKKAEDSESKKFWESCDAIEWSYDNRNGDLSFFKTDKNMHASNNVNEKKEDKKFHNSAKMKWRYIHCGEDYDLCFKKNSQNAKHVKKEENEFDSFIYS